MDILLHYGIDIIDIITLHDNRRDHLLTTPCDNKAK